MEKRKALYSLCSLLMAFLFAYSASVQLNDPDWYFWFPLYGVGSMVNLLNCVISSERIKNISEATLWLGILLFIKVVAEDLLNGEEKQGFFSLDLSKRVVREKTGSGLVIISMVLQLIASSSSCKDLNQKKRKLRFPRFVDYGMAILVGFSYALPFVFFVVQKGKMEF